MTLSEQIKNLEARKKSTINLWLRGIGAGNYKSVDDIKAFYDQQINELHEAKIKAQQTIIRTDVPTLSSTSEPIKEVKAATRIQAPSYTSPKQIAELRSWQQDAVDEVYHSLYALKHRAHYIEAVTGGGKTFIGGAIIRRALDEEQHIKHMCLSPYPYVWIVPPAVIEQVTRVLEFQFGIDVLNSEVLITNYDQLRSSFGKQLLKWDLTIKNGEEIWKPIWHKQMRPHMIICDEAHKLKNEQSQQSQIFQALNDIEDNKTKQIHMSATPGTRVSDFKCFAVATGLEMY